MCRLRNIAMRDYQESVTTGQTDRWTDRQTLDKVIPMCHYASSTETNFSQIYNNIVAAFRGMHGLPAKHSYAWLPRKCDYRTDRQTPDKVIPMCRHALQECMGCLRNIAMRDYQESVTTGQTDRCRTKWSLCAAMLCRRHKKESVVYTL